MVRSIVRTIALTLFTLTGWTTVSPAADWCIRPGPTACEVQRSEAMDTVTFNLPNNYQVKLTNVQWGNQKVEIRHNDHTLQHFIAGLPEVPLNTPQYPLTQPLNLYNVMLYRTDGVIEIGTGSQRSYYFALNGGLLLVPVNNNFVTVWLLGNNAPRTFVEMEPLVQYRMSTMNQYLNLPAPSAGSLSNYYVEQPGETDSPPGQGPECCCGGTGKKTLIIGLGGCGSENCNNMEGVFDGLSEKEKECVRFVRHPYDPSVCAEDNAAILKDIYNALKEGGNYCKIQIAAHSQAGIIAGYAAGEMPEAEVHTFGSPLQGTSLVGAVPMGTMWTIGYIFPIPGGSLIADELVDCMKQEASSSHNYPPLAPGASFTTHTSEPSSTFPLSTQAGGPQGSRSKHHPGTDHTSVMNEGLEDMTKKESCTECGNGKPEQPTEECDPPASACQTAANTPGECTDECKCEPLCGNGFLDPGEECDPPGTANICICNYGGMHNVLCTNDCKIPNCDHYEPEPVPTASVVTVCGDNKVTGSEQCDPPGSQCTGMTPSGSGTCNSECQCVDNCVDCQDTTGNF